MENTHDNQVSPDCLAVATNYIAPPLLPLNELANTQQRFP